MRPLIAYLVVANLMVGCVGGPAKISYASTDVAINEAGGGGRSTLLTQGPVVYPPLARENRVTASTVMRVVLEPSGKVVKVEAVSATASKAIDVNGQVKTFAVDFARAAQASLMASTWRIEGNAGHTDIAIDIPVNFELPRTP